MIGLAVGRELLTGIARVLPARSEVGPLGAGPERARGLRDVRADVTEPRALRWLRLLGVDLQARRLRREVARTDALTGRDREVERPAAGVSRRVAHGVRAQAEVHPEQEW